MPQRDAPDGTPLTLGEEPAYCPTCGAPVSPQLLEDDHRPRLVCPNGHVTWRNPRLVVGTLPVRGGRVFLARRSIEPGAGLWTYPGGFLEVGESAQEGARRETEEETQLRIEVGRLIGAYSRPHVGVVTLIYEATVVGGQRAARASRPSRCATSGRMRSRGRSWPSPPSSRRCATGWRHCRAAGRASSRSSTSPATPRRSRARA